MSKNYMYTIIRGTEVNLKIMIEIIALVAV
jgi:hypothetical protein